MNANKLADELEKCCLVSWGECNHEDYDTDIWTKMKSATMLRQQQAEIEALKKEAALQRLSDFTQEIEAKYGITTKWDGITTYHETTEPIGKAQEK